MKKFLLAALLIALPFTPVSPACADDVNTAERAKIEQVVKDLLQREPELVLQAAQDAQGKQQQKQLEAASAGIKTAQKDLTQNAASPASGASAKEADITVVEFYDYNCGYCKKAAPTVRQVIAADKKVRVIYKEFPILGPTSLTAAQYAFAVKKQDPAKFVAFHDKLMDSHDPVTEDELQRFVTELKLDPAKAKADAASPEIKAQIEADLALGQKVGVQGTPGFVIGDKLYPGAMDLASMQKVIADTRAGK